MKFTMKHFFLLFVILLLIASFGSFNLYSTLQPMSSTSIIDKLKFQANSINSGCEEELLRLAETQRAELDKLKTLKKKWTSLVGGESSLPKTIKRSLKITGRSSKYDLNPDIVCYTPNCDVQPNNIDAYASDCSEEADTWNTLGIQAMERYIDGDSYGETNVKNAEYYFANATHLDPTCHRAYANLGLTLLEGKNYHDAIKQFSEAIKLNSKQAKYYAYRSFAHELVRDENNRLADLNSALAIDPYIIERRYFGILLGNTTKPELFKLYPLIFHYGDQQQEFALKTLTYTEFSKESFSGYSQLPPTTTDEFLKESWIVVRRILHPFLLKWAAKNYRDTIRSKYLTLGDPQSLRYRGINDRVARILQFHLVDFVRRVVGNNVWPTYTYFGGYLNSSYLNPHTDRPPCEFSISLTMEQYPADQPWPLGLGVKPMFEKDPNYVGADKLAWPPESERRWALLNAGDGLLFMGRHLIHFRDGHLGEGRWLNQAFLHYVPEDYKGGYE